jgi:hypothetical protein
MKSSQLLLPIAVYLAGCSGIDVYRRAAWEILDVPAGNEWPANSHNYYCWIPEPSPRTIRTCTPQAADRPFSECLRELRAGEPRATSKGEARNQIIACMSSKRWNHVMIEVTGYGSRAF